MGIMTELAKFAVTDSGRNIIKSVTTTALSILIAKAIIDNGKVNRRMSTFERDLTRAEDAIDEALGRGRRRDRDRYREEDDYDYYEPRGRRSYSYSESRGRRRTSPRSDDYGCVR